MPGVSTAQRTSMISLPLKYLHAIIFTIMGGYVTGWPLASARWYLAYLFGLVLIWTLPLNKRSQFWGYAVLAIGVLAKAYVGYITPGITVQTVPIAMYKGQLAQHHSSFSKELTKVVHANFAKDIDIFSKNPKALPPITTIAPKGDEPIPKRFQDLGRRSSIEDRSVQLVHEDQRCDEQRTQSLKGEGYILYDFRVGYNFIDRSKIWTLPVDVQKAFTTVPVALAIQVNQADHGIIWPSDWKNCVFFEQKSDQTIQTHKGSPNGVVLKDHIGSTLFFPLIDSPKPGWIYIALCPWAAYIPLLVLLAAILLVNFTHFSACTLEHLICLSFAFITICHNDLHPYWPFCSFPYDSLHSLSNWIHEGIWDSHAGQAPLWYLVNKLFYPISYFGYVLPMLCFWTSAGALLQLLREFFKPSQSYIIWGILLAGPWLARQGIGLHVFRPWHTVYSSLMLGAPLFLIGLRGYIRDFKQCHGIAWVAASLCNPAILAGVSGLLLHKHLGRQRFIYLVASLGLCTLGSFNHLFSADMLLSNPVTAFFLTKHYFTSFESLGPILDVCYFIRNAYQPFFIIFGLIPNICMAFSKDISWKRFARACLIMHGGFIISANISQEAYLACTLSSVCSFIYLVPYYERFIYKHQQLTAKSQ